MKKSPAYWWDFGKVGEVIVESDCDKHPVVGRFAYVGRNAEPAIHHANKLIADLNSGRATPKAC